MYNNFINELIDTSVFKPTVVIRRDQPYMFKRLKEDEDILAVHSNVLYQLYALYADGAQIETRPTFFRMVGLILQYEKLHCKHGDEYYYLLKFNESSAFYQKHKELIERMILESDPSTLYDYYGTNDINSYNKVLKKKKEL